MIALQGSDRSCADGGSALVRRPRRVSEEMEEMSVLLGFLLFAFFGVREVFAIIFKVRYSIGH